MKYYSKDEIKKADSLDIAELLRRNGEIINTSAGYYTTERHDSLRIRGSTFVWYSRNIYGHTIKLIMEYYNLSFYDAVSFILNNSNLYYLNITTHKNIEKEKCENIEQINESFNKNRVIAYLCNSRYISYETVIELLNKKILSQDDHGNAVFKAYNETNVFVGGEIRVCSDKSKYRRIIAGTKSGYGVQIIKGTPTKVYFFESAIDMISFYDLYKNKLKHCLLTSMGGLKSIVIEKTLERFNLNYDNVILCVDGDDAGDRFVKNIVSKNKSVSYILLKNSKDWNDFLKSKKNENV